jgi:hypothetical protein
MAAQGVAAGYPTRPVALAEALVLVEEAPQYHNLTGVHFGEFAKGGFYVSLNFAYSWGNTQGDVGRCEPDTREIRIKKIVAAYDSWTQEDKRDAKSE